MMDRPPLLQARQVFKGFFGNPVLKGVSITLQPGRIHALLGENGAGKSTLINLLSGTLVPDSGHILLNGQEVSRFSPADARRAGIAVVQQELSLMLELSIAENIGLGAYPKRFGFVDYRALHEQARGVCDLVGLQEDLDTPVGDLSLGRRQLVEIAKALFRKPKVLILDEPTSSLSAHEAGILSSLMIRLRDEGVALLFISHRLNEVRALCSHVTILKDGVVTADQPLADVDAEGLVRLMVGRDAGDLFPTWTPTLSSRELINVSGLSAGMVRSVDFSARAGEVVGIGGLVGQGQEDFLLGLYGALPASAVKATICGHDGLFAEVGSANAAGLAYVPADRKREGLILPHSIASNLILPNMDDLARKFLRDRVAERNLVSDLAKRLTIRGDTQRPVQALSGGNQQKVALAKWLPRMPSVLLLNDPTRGVDIETKREIYLMLRAFAAEGKLVILLSSDTPELVYLCDRVIVFSEGRNVALLERDAISEEAIVGAAMGISEKGVAA